MLSTPPFSLLPAYSPCNYFYWEDVSVNRILETAVIQEWMVRTLSQQYLPYRLQDLLVLHCHTSGMSLLVLFVVIISRGRQHE
ncbi:hypothetical protein THOG05_40079 [Vibrio rotiferianus]|nr:hypothetical protein THOG05_40079 [Vibrio rotiferianus]CAH1578653.1 hypothetical protein THOE12_50394 [Vibrio rotiferianus]